MIVNQEIFEEGSSCYDPTPMQYQQFPEDGYSQNIVPNCNPTFPMEEQQLLSYQHQDAVAAANTATMELELQQQIGLDNIMDQSHLLQDPNHQIPNWESTHHEMNYNHYSQIQEMQTNCNTNINHHQNFINSTEPQYPQTPDLLNLFHLPRCSSSLLPNSTISFTNLPNSESGSGSSVLYDPMFHLNLPPPLPMLREMLQSFPNGYNLPGTTRNGTLFDGMEERESNGDQFDTGVLEFNGDINSLAKGRGAKNTKHFATEKQRRVHINDKYTALKALVPNPSKADRASIVEDAIQYIKELQRTVNELQGLVEKKRYSRERLMRRQKEEEESGLEVEGNYSNIKAEGDGEQAYNGPSLRSSWLRRKSKNTEVDVRIIDDEVTIKLVQQKRINCLLFVSRVLDELQLDLQHVAGGLIGDFYSFLFNTRIYEGSSVYASAIANKIIDVVDRQYAAASQPTTSY